MFSRIVYLLVSIFGEILKWMCKLHILTPKFTLEKNHGDRHLVVSLTSYGRRVASTVPYTIISLLRQTYKPDELILWLDDEHWSEKNIPSSLKRLQKYGLSIMFCEDIRSYKKLVPTLLIRPNCLVMTADDDVYYPSDTIKRLIDEYDNNPEMVYCNIAHKIKIDDKKGVCNYKEWDDDIYGETGPFVFPVGIGCVLYDPKLLHNDVTKKNLFMQLSPLADDVWFFFMEQLKGTKCCVLKQRKTGSFYPIDTFYQATHNGSSLVKQNVGEDMNDVQIKKVMDYYGLIADPNKGIIPKC